MIYNYNLLFKYILVGNASVGKSSLLLRFIDNQFSDNYECTLGVQFGSKTFPIGDLAIKTMIWDTAGQESFKSIIRSYYKNSIVAILVFDITDQQSFLDLQRWIDQIKTHANQQTRIVIVGNKIDLEQKRVVRRQEAREYAASRQISYFQASAKTGQGVGEIFTKPAEELIADIESKKIVIEGNENAGIKIGNPNLIDADRYSKGVMPSPQKSAIQIGREEESRSKCQC